MNKKFKIVGGISLAAGMVAVVYRLSKKERNNMLFNENELTENEDGVCENTESIKELSPIEKEKISDSIKGMSEQELRIVLQNIPVGLMFDEVMVRLAKYEQFTDYVQDALNCLPR